MAGWEVIVPWIISIISIGVTYWVARISKKMQSILSSRDKEIELIDSRLACLREDMVRLHEAFGLNPRESYANVLVAYAIIVANPLADDELHKAVRKIREFTAIYVFGLQEAACNGTIEQSDTFQSAIDEACSAYRKIVEAEYEKRETILKSYK